MKVDMGAIAALIAELRAEVERGVDPAIAALARTCGKGDEWLEAAAKQTAAVADTLEGMASRIDRLEKELARASGVARAKGEHAYADDFMRVAMDREDFDAEIAAVKR